jgi:hypothetical protein
MAERWTTHPTASRSCTGDVLLALRAWCLCLELHVMLQYGQRACYVCCALCGVCHNTEIRACVRASALESGSIDPWWLYHRLVYMGYCLL